MMKQISSKDQISLNNLIVRSCSNKYLIKNASLLNNRFLVFDNEYSIDRSNVLERNSILSASINNLALFKKVSSESKDNESFNYLSSKSNSKGNGFFSSISKLCEPTNYPNRLNFMDFNKSTKIRPIMDYYQTFKLLLIISLIFIPSAKAGKFLHSNFLSIYFNRF